MQKYLITISIVVSLLILSQCSRRTCDCTPPTIGAKNLAYSDSIFFLKTNDYIVAPLGGRSGTYTAFPDNLLINRTTGAITITQKGTDGESQTGMWYKIRYRSATNELDSTMILLSGITYLDKFYTLSQNDSIIHPIYNGDPANSLPSGDYDLTSDNKFAVNPVNGQINIKECMRRGFFGSASWKVATVKYAINDKSQMATNKIDLVIYYYKSMNEVPSNVSAIMQAHQQMTVGLRALPNIPSTTGIFDSNLPSNLSLSKPRPPCVIIVGN